MSLHPFKESGEKYEIEKIQEWHKEILRLAVLGYRPGEIANATGYSKTHISNIFNSEVFKAELEVLQAARDDDSVSVAKRIVGMAPIATERLLEVIREPIFKIDGESVKVDERIEPSLKIKVAQDILDRAGHKAIDKKVIAHLTKDDLKEMKHDAIEAGIEAGYIHVVEEEDDTVQNVKV